MVSELSPPKDKWGAADDAILAQSKTVSLVPSRVEPPAP